MINGDPQTISATRAAPKQFGGVKPGSAGVLMAGVEAQIVRDDGTLAGPKEPGELWIKGENVALGYWKNEKATRETFVDGWLRTGDRFYVDEDGHFLYALFLLARILTVMLILRF